METDQADIIEVNEVNSPVPDCGEDKSETEQPSELWQPPVDLRHLNEEQQEHFKAMLNEESNAFARDDSDIGCVPSLQISITLKDDIVVQRSYASVPKPLYQEYIQDLLEKKWIVKSMSPYSAPVVCVRKKDVSLRLSIDYR